ncbi:sensor histidine kinase, partial [Desulfosarcina sp.]|uniref:sensor histidine kinase n=1 Tax=Desulfosarcina sp. TaxID=2027861 RepID=UPI003566C065
EQLQYVELYKGSLFVMLTALLIFAALFFLFQRLQRKERDGQKQRDAIMAAGKQAMAGLFASSIAHDLNNILTVSQFAIEKLSQSKELKASDMVHVDNLQSVNNQVQDYAKRLADVSGKHQSSEIHKTNMVSAVAVAMKLARTHKTVKRCSIKSELPEMSYAAVDESILLRGLLNLIVNAAEATGERGQILVKLSGDDEHIRLEVNDDGPGIPSEERNRVLEAFYTTKPDGTGLGLLSMRYCAEVHGGTFGIETSFLGGACVYIVLPRRGARKNEAPR